jgi:hypothetical protein
MSDLRQAVSDYLAIRRALGFQLRGYDRLLGDLVDDLQRAGTSTLTIELAVAWASKPAGAQPFRCKTRLSIARGFARYLQTIDPAAQVPPSNLLHVPRLHHDRPGPHDGEQPPKAAAFLGHLAADQREVPKGEAPKAASVASRPRTGRLTMVEREPDPGLAGTVGDLKRTRDRNARGP